MTIISDDSIPVDPCKPLEWRAISTRARESSRRSSEPSRTWLGLGLGLGLGLDSNPNPNPNVTHRGEQVARLVLATLGRTAGAGEEGERPAARRRRRLPAACPWLGL